MDSRWRTTWGSSAHSAWVCAPSLATIVKLHRSSSVGYSDRSFTVLGALLLVVGLGFASGCSGDGDDDGGEPPQGDADSGQVEPTDDDEDSDGEGSDSEGASASDRITWPPTPVVASGLGGVYDETGPRGELVGTLDLAETSALVASRLVDGVFWTIQDRSDSEERAHLIGFRISEGELDKSYGKDGMRVLPVADVANVDWETLAPGPDGTLLIGDLGNNDCKRSDQKILQVREPDETTREVELVARFPVEFPDTAATCGGKNTEASMLLDGDAYLLAKTDDPVLYRLPLDQVVDGVANPLELLGPISQPAGGFNKLTTAMATNDAGDRVVVATAGERFWIYEASGDSSTELLEALASESPMWSRNYDLDSDDTQIEGAAFVPRSNDIVLVGEDRSVWYWPAESYEAAALN